MAEQKKNPIIEFETDKPRTLKLIKNWGSGTSKSGDPWQGWEVEDTEQKQTYSMFVYDANLQKALKFALTGGGEVVVTKKVGENPQTKKAFHYFDVKEAFFSGDGGTPSNSKTPEAIEAFRSDRRKKLQAAIEDVLAVECALVDAAEYAPEDLKALFTPEVIQRFATTLLIDDQKR